MIWRKLKHLLPWVRRADDKDIQEELQALEAIAGRQALGNVTLAAEDARAASRIIWFEHLIQDLAYTARSIRHNTLFTALVVTSLALGIGANTAIFSFVESVLLRPLPVADPSALVIMKWRAKDYSLASSGITWSTSGSTTEAVPPTGVLRLTSSPAQTMTLSSSFPYPALRVFQDSTDIVAAAFSYFAVERLSLSADRSTDSVKGHYVSGDYFRGMGVAPAAGRLIQPADDVPAAASVAVLSFSYARLRFGDPVSAVGRAVQIDGKSFEIVGVTPSAFFGAEPGAVPDLYLPMRAQTVVEPGFRAETYLDDHYYWAEMMARLKPGVSFAQAQATLAARFRAYVEGTAQTDLQRQDLPALELQPGAGGLDGLRRRYASPIYALVIMVALILLITCANIANLLLGRAAARRREIAVRLSIGAGRWRIVRQLLTESLVLSLLGGALGVVLAWWGVGVLTGLLAGGREHFSMHAEVNWTVLAVTTALSVFAGVLFGLAPALHATRVEVLPALKVVRAGDTVTKYGRLRLGSILMVAQVALSLCLLVAAALFGRSLSNLHRIELGFTREHVLLFTLRPKTAGYETAELGSLYERLRERLQVIPGALGASLSSRPFPMGGGTITRVRIDDESALPIQAAAAPVGPDFFGTMRMFLAAGREFTPADHATAPRVVVVNRMLAGKAGLDNLVGHTLLIGKDRAEIVGMVDDAVSFGLKEERRPIMYLSYLQTRAVPSQMTFEIRTAGDPMSLAGAVRDVVRQTDPRLAVHDLKSQAVHVDEAISREITLARLGSMFGGLALLIACVGVYGTVNFGVARRTNEIGIRLALGAPASRVVGMMMREALLAAGLGLAIGLAMSLALAKYARALLYGIEPTDPVSIAAAVGVLLIGGLLAAFVPARRATRIDPLAAVRED